MKVYRENLIAALSKAINEQRKYERIELHYTRDSGLVTSWRETLAALDRGEQLEVIE